MLRFASLGSGSTGNATLVEAHNGFGSTLLLIDCGFSLRELSMRLGRLGFACEQLDAVFVTHEHGDHVGCALALARRYGVPLWMSRGTWHTVDDGEPMDGLLHFARDGVPIEIGDMLLQPYTVPHDAREPLQLCCSDGHRKLGVLTDAGSITAHLLEQLQACTALLLECNHDPDLLAMSSYPASLKRRVAGPHGHLSNRTAAQILSACLHAGLRHVVAAHLSQNNNRPVLAQAALADVLGIPADDVDVACPNSGISWREL